MKIGKTSSHQVVRSAGLMADIDQRDCANEEKKDAIPGDA